MRVVRRHRSPGDDEDSPAVGAAGKAMVVARFGELEAAIMDRVWAADGPVRVRDVVTGLQQDRQIAYTTVQTVMEILYRKGWLARERDGRAHRYAATASRAEYTARLMGEALATSDDRGAALARFVERMDSAEAEELRHALDAARTGTATEPGSGDAADSARRKGAR